MKYSISMFFVISITVFIVFRDVDLNGIEIIFCLILYLIIVAGLSEPIYFA